jgi:anthranilate phosphoribosyltransferase
MVNPSFPQNQLVGVFNLELARMYAYLYQDTSTNFTNFTFLMATMKYR